MKINNLQSKLGAELLVELGAENCHNLRVYSNKVLMKTHYLKVTAIQ